MDIFGFLMNFFTDYLYLGLKSCDYLVDYQFVYRKIITRNTVEILAIMRITAG